ncbi:PEGA domain-containing protein [Candidatus Nomurabacteria bacterium]|nr:PEGA domain-containing protein [Candidatus Nomurabacteria bacterium]
MIKKYTKLAIFCLAFIVISPIIVLYAKGDIFTSGWNILKTGGIYITSAPIGSEIFINSQLKGLTSFFSRNVLIKSLRPNTYEVLVKKEGYNAWTNKIKVSDNFVSDANVFMLPTEIKLEEIKKFDLTQKDSEKITIPASVKNKEYEDVNLVFSSPSVLTQKTSANTTPKIDFKGNLGTKNSPIMDGKLGVWREGGEVFVAWFGRNDTAPKYLCRESDCMQTISVFNFGKPVRNINFFPEYDGVIIVALENKIEAFQADPHITKLFQKIYVGQSPDFRIIDEVLYIKDRDFIAKVTL